jgi:hypothetical protein
MKSRSAVLLAMLALSLGLTRPARADFTDWTYTVSRDPVSILSSSGNSGVSLAVDAGGAAKSSITAVVLTTFSSSQTSDPVNGSYSVSLNITDGQNNSGSVTFTGALNGSLSNSSTNLTNGFTSNTTQTVTIGSHKYTVTADYTAPGAPGSGKTGSITFSVSVADASNGGGNGNGGGSQAPEPSTLVLAGLAVPVCLGAWMRRNRRPPLMFA